MKIEIPEAHGEAIAERTQIMQQIFSQFNLLRSEDKRHVNAVLKSLAQDPDAFEQYVLEVKDRHYYLELTPKASPAVADNPEATKDDPLPQAAPVNGVSHPIAN